MARALFGIVNGIAIGNPPAAKVWICGTPPPTNGGGMNDSFPSNSAGSPSDGSVPATPSGRLADAIAQAPDTTRDSSPDIAVDIRGEWRLLEPPKQLYRFCQGRRMAARNRLHSSQISPRVLARLSHLAAERGEPWLGINRLCHTGLKCWVELGPCMPGEFSLRASFVHS